MTAFITEYLLTELRRNMAEITYFINLINIKPSDSIWIIISSFALIWPCYFLNKHILIQKIVHIYSIRSINLIYWTWLTFALNYSCITNCLLPRKKRRIISIINWQLIAWMLNIKCFPKSLHRQNVQKPRLDAYPCIWIW